MAVTVAAEEPDDFDDLDLGTDEDLDDLLAAVDGEEAEQLASRG